MEKLEPLFFIAGPPKLLNEHSANFLKSSLLRGDDYTYWSERGVRQFTKRGERSATDG
jgi:hypothetical protein